jgi:hypothetical protein
VEEGGKEESEEMKNGLGKNGRKNKKGKEKKRRIVGKMKTYMVAQGL